MLTVTQRCDSCGRRVPIAEGCAGCTPGRARSATALGGSAGLWVGLLLAGAALLQLV